MSVAAIHLGVISGLRAFVVRVKGMELVCMAHDWGSDMSPFTCIRPFRAHTASPLSLPTQHFTLVEEKSLAKGGLAAALAFAMEKGMRCCRCVLWTDRKVAIETDSMVFLCAREIRLTLISSM